jgi:hypothetical protein
MSPIKNNKYKKSCCQVMAAALKRENNFLFPVNSMLTEY